nr:MAG TPA: hypothetical protein [Caudoviricetes sp.]
MLATYSSQKIVCLCVKVYPSTIILPLEFSLMATDLTSFVVFNVYILS